MTNGRKLIAAIALAAGMGTMSACYAEGRATYGGGYAYAEPSLAYVSPGLYVVADYDYPVFYVNNFYWAYRDGVWMRSRFYNRGFVRVGTVPTVVARIGAPHYYVHYRAGRMYRPREVRARMHPYVQVRTRHYVRPYNRRYR